MGLTQRLDVANRQQKAEVGASEVLASFWDSLSAIVSQRTPDEFSRLKKATANVMNKAQVRRLLLDHTNYDD